MHFKGKEFIPSVAPLAVHVRHHGIIFFRFFGREGDLLPDGPPQNLSVFS